MTDKVMNEHQIELEYTALRSEILKRIELRQQIIAITLTLAGIFLSVGLTAEMVALIYPPLAMFLALAWAQNDFRIRDLATYLRCNVEAASNSLHYETYVQEARRKSKGLGSWRMVVLSHSGIFVFTQIMAVGIELAKGASLDFPPLKWLLLTVDLAAIVVVFWVARQARR